MAIVLAVFLKGGDVEVGFLAAYSGREVSFLVFCIR